MEMLSFKEYIAKDKPRAPGDLPHMEWMTAIGHLIPQKIRRAMGAYQARQKAKFEPERAAKLNALADKFDAGRNVPKLEERVRTPGEASKLLGKIAKRQQREGLRKGITSYGGDRINLPKYKIRNEVEKVSRAFTNPRFIRAGLTGKQAKVQDIPIDKIEPSQPSVFTDPKITKKKMEKNDPNKAAVLFKRKDGSYLTADGHHYTLERKAAGDKTVRARVYEGINL